MGIQGRHVLGNGHTLQSYFRTLMARKQCVHLAQVGVLPRGFVFAIWEGDRGAVEGWDIGGRKGAWAPDGRMVDRLVV